MNEEIVGQPLTEVTLFECPTCRKGPIRNDTIHHPYPCPFCGVVMPVVGTEWEERGTHHDRPETV